MLKSVYFWLFQYVCSKCRTLKSSSTKLFQSRLNQSAIQVNQDTTNLALNATKEHKRSLSI